MPEKFERGTEAYADELRQGAFPTAALLSQDEHIDIVRQTMLCQELRDNATRAVLKRMGVPLSDGLLYFNFGRRLDRLRSRMLDGPSLELAIDNAIGEWQRKGLDRAVLLAIAGRRPEVG